MGGRGEAATRGCSCSSPLLFQAQFLSCETETTVGSTAWSVERIAPESPR